MELSDHRHNDGFYGLFYLIFSCYDILFYDFFIVSGQVDSIRMQDYTGVYAKFAFCRKIFAETVVISRTLHTLTHTHARKV